MIDQIVVLFEFEIHQTYICNTKDKINKQSIY